MSDTLDRPRRANLQQAVQHHVKQYIIENGHRPGDLLPPESQFAQQLGVSRPNLREAMRALQTMGIVESRQGSGTFVGHFSMDPWLEGMSFSIQTSDDQNALRTLREILEVRAVLERHIIRQTAESITDEQLDVLSELVERMHARANAGEAFPEEDMAFHEAVYVSLGNRFIVQLVRTFWQLIAQVDDQLRSIDQELHDVARMHGRILDALRDRDPDLAERAMADHLDGIRERVSRAGWR